MRAGAPAAVLGLLLAALLTGCATAGPAAGPSRAILRVEALRGFSVPRAPLEDGTRQVEVLLDVTPSMQAKADPLGSRLAAGKRGAEALLAGLPSDVTGRLHAFGHRDGALCGGSSPVSAPLRGDATAEAAAALSDLRPRGEASLAAALSSVHQQLRAESGVQGARLAVFTDFDDPCEADACAAAHALVGEGAWIDWYALAPGDAPACLDAMDPWLTGPGHVAGELTAPQAGFRVLRAGADEETLASGLADGTPVVVPAGALSVVADLDPPERIGPFRVAPGEQLTIRVLDFPMAQPPQRVWRVEREGQRFDPTLPEAPEFPPFEEPS